MKNFSPGAMFKIGRENLHESVLPQGTQTNCVTFCSFFENEERSCSLVPKEMVCQMKEHVRMVALAITGHPHKLCDRL